MDKPKVTKH